ncbi:hypothetical protein SMICM17S_02547 [Streptomyces microflavus]
MTGGLLGLRGGGAQQALGVLAGAQQNRFRFGPGRLGLRADALPGLLGQPGGLGPRCGERLLGLGAGLVQQPAGLRLGAGPQLFGPGDVLVDVRLDGLPALGQLLVELLPALDGLVVQLRLQARLVLGVLLEDALCLGPRLAQLALGVAAQLLGLDLRVPQELFGLVAHVRAVVGGTGRQTAPRLVQLGAQDLDLVAEVLGVLDGLLPVGLQPVHLGFEPREMVVFSSVALLAFVAPHCAVPSFPELSTSFEQGRPQPCSQRVPLADERSPGEW